MALTRRLVVGLTALVLAACTTTASPSPSAVPSTVASQTAAVCNPAAPPTLIGPDGTQVVLGDGPGGTSAWVNEKGMAFYLRQIGDCIWIIGYEPASDGGQVPLLTSFHGRLGADFRIVGTFSDTTGVLIPGYDSGAFAYRVTFEGADTVLLEDRTEGGPPGCTGGDGACPAPRELRRAEG